MLLQSMVVLLVLLKQHTLAFHGRVAGVVKAAGFLQFMAVLLVLLRQHAL